MRESRVPPLHTVNTVITTHYTLLTLLGLVVAVLAVKVPVVVDDVLVVVVFSTLGGVEFITNLMVLVAVKPLLSKSEAVSRFQMLPTLNATEALEMSFQFRITLSEELVSHLKKCRIIFISSLN